MIIMEEMKEEEEILQVTMENITVLKIIQDILGMKVVSLINLDISLFLHSQ